MLKRRILGLLLSGLVLAGPALAAPLFPDVKDDHWAKDAVAALAAKGLLEGYPDGTFKGDRAASRWEVAMIVARLLAKMEQAHATFATKAELEDLRKLANALREELDALGVRVKNLEENVDRLDHRVTELERITFYGYVDTRASSISIQNTGLPAMRSINPGIAVNTIDYNAIAGAAAGASGVLPNNFGPGGPPMVPTFNPFTTGVLGVTNWRTGRPLVSGTSFTSKAILGLKIKVSDDVDAGAEFAAYTSQGSNPLIDAYYGVSAPYLSNAFTATTTVTGGGAGLQGLNHQPYTNMTLDNFWVRHNPSKTKLIVGAYRGTNFDRNVYSGIINPNEFGPEYLDNFGFQVTGEHEFGEEEGDLRLNYEVMGTKLPDGNLGGLPAAGFPGAGSSYFTHLEGINAKLSFHEDRGNVKLQAIHVANDASGGSAGQVGLIVVPNLTLNWVNPNGSYFNQLGGPNINTAGIASTSDVRPIVPFQGLNADGSVAAQVAAGLLPAGAPNVGGFGPQDMTTYGISASYKWDNEYEPRIYGEYSHSDYRPSKNSSYSTSGNVFRIGAGALFAEKTVELDLNYMSVDPRYSPFIIQIPAVNGLNNNLYHTPDFSYYNNLFPLQNTHEYNPNREGLKAKVTWKFVPTGRITVEYANLHQTETSLQDVRFGAGALGGGAPNTPVLGYSPGFLEPVFSGYNPFTFAAAGGNALAIPLENNRGTQEGLSVVGGYKYLFDEENSNRGVLFSGGIRSWHFRRNSNMQSILPGTGFGTQAENQNFVDFAFQGARFGVDYDLTDDFTVKGAITRVEIFGHFDPLGVTNGFAEATGRTRFNNIDITQTWPELGFEWRINDDVTWSLEGKYFAFKDNLPTSEFVSPTVPTLNINTGPNFAHPFNWEGLQINTQFGVKF